MGQSSSGEALVKEKIWTKDFTLIVFANFFVFLCFQMTLPTIPLYINQLGGNDQLIGIVVGVFTFSALLIRPYAGQALESRGRRFVFLTGLSIFTLATGMFGFVASMFFIFALRIIQGVGWGLSTTASGTIATDLIPANRRGEGMGYFGLAGNLALAFGPTLGLALAGFISFEKLFLICGILSVVAFLLATPIRYKKVEQKAVAIKKWDFYEKTALPPSLLMFFITVPFGGIASFLPIYSAQKGIGGLEWYFLLYAVALMLTRLYAGKLYDLKGHQAVFFPGTILIIGSMLLLAWLPNSLVMYIAAILFGLGFGTVQPALQAWAVRDATDRRKGMANATFFSFFDLGVGIGAICFGQIAYYFNYSAIYLVAAFSIFGAIFLYLYFLKKEKQMKLQSN